MKINHIYLLRIDTSAVSRLSRPDRVSKLPHQLQLRDHIIPRNRISEMVAREAALGTDANPLQGLVSGLARPLGHDVSGSEDALAQLVHVLERGELAGDDAEDDVLVGRQLLEGLERPRPLRVVLQEVRVDVDLVEQLRRDAVVPALREVPAVGEVAPAQVDPHV